MNPNLKLIQERSPTITLFWDFGSWRTFVLTASEWYEEGIYAPAQCVQFHIETATKLRDALDEFLTKSEHESAKPLRSS